MKFRAKVIGEIVKDVKRFDRKLGVAVTGGMKEATTGLKNSLRAQVQQAGMSQRLANTWRSVVYPESPGATSKNAAGIVFSKAPHIIFAYDHGTVIRSRRGKYLAVPLPTVQKFIKAGATRRKITPELVSKQLGQKLQLIERPGKNPLLVARGVRVRKSGSIAAATVRKATARMGERVNLDGLAFVPLFVLIPQAQVRKKLDTEKAFRDWGARLPKMIDQRMAGKT